MFNKSIFWLLILQAPVYGMYEERPTLRPLSPQAVKLNGIQLGFHTMNDVDPNFTYVIATISADYRVRFDRVHITWQPVIEKPAFKIEPEGVHTTDDTIVVNFKIPKSQK